MEKLLIQILEGQNKLFSEVSGLKDGQQQLFKEVSGLKSDVSSLKDGQQQLSKEVSGLKDDIIRLEGKVDKIANASENDTLSVINLMSKKMDNLATKDDVKKLNSSFEVLNSRLFHQEVELYELKAVK